MTHNKSVLITGGTGSLGYHAAKAIVDAHEDWRVVVTGRGAEAVESAAARLGNNSVGVPLDLCSLRGVRQFAHTLAQLDLPPLHAIVCNAGIEIVSGLCTTSDGYEQTFAVNHLAHLLLVQELVPHLARPARIVFVASDVHDPANPTAMPAPQYRDAEELASPVDTATENIGVAGRRRYATSKLCNVLTTYELARRLDAGDESSLITVNAFDPGLMPGSGLARDYATWQRLAWRYVLPLLTILPGVNIHTPRRSGAALARLVLDPALSATTGQYFSGMRQVKSSVESYDEDKAAKLWTGSIGLIERALAADDRFGP